MQTLQDHSIARNVAWRYKLALLIIALLSIFAYFNLTELIHRQFNYAQIINLSGKERMYSQQIALFALAKEPERLEESIANMQKNLSFISQLASPTIRQAIDTLLPFLHRYIQLARDYLHAPSPSLKDSLLQQSQTIVTKLDGIVAKFQQESEATTALLLSKERLILFLTLFTLLLEALFIFQPIIKKLKEFTKKLQSEKILEDTVIESSPVGIIAVDKRMQPQIFNHKAQKIFGYTPQEIREKGLRAIIPKELYPAHEKAFYAFANSDRTTTKEQVYELEGVHKDGHRFPIRISFGATKIENDKIIVANVEDITEEKEKDHILMQQSRIAALGEMIGNIAHQWRQPLNAIKITTSGLLLKSEIGTLTQEEIKQELQKVNEHVDYLSQTIDDFRNFTKGDRHKERFDLSEIVQKALTLTEASYRHHDIEVRNHIQGKYILQGYPSELMQVLLNILNNAKDAFKERDIPKRIVELDLKEEEGHYIISICDSAGGIEEEHLLKIFDPYFTTKHQSQGTGIGLYMSKQIVENHFGGVLIAKNSELDGHKGACFIIKLPKK